MWPYIRPPDTIDSFLRIFYIIFFFIFKNQDFLRPSIASRDGARSKWMPISRHENDLFRPIAAVLLVILICDAIDVGDWRVPARPVSVPSRDQQLKMLFIFVLILYLFEFYFSPKE